MIRLHDRQYRGVTQTGWLDSRHTFSFAGFHDPQRMGASSLRVINEDRVAPGAGFGEHGHRDMEILTYVLEGALAHRDSMGNGSTIRPGEIQLMSAGSGVTHSEMNASREAPVHFLQIWIEPNRRGLSPSYQQLALPEGDEARALHVIVAPASDGEGPANGQTASIRQDARVLRALPQEGDALDYAPAAGRMAFVHIAKGLFDWPGAGASLHAGDGLELPEGASVSLQAATEGEILLFDLPA